jgi:CBS domain-containing protein
MPTGTTSQPLDHTFAAPPFAEASVVDAMRMGVVRCPPDTPAEEVARIMATYRIHFVVVSEIEDGRPTGVISDIDLARAAAAGPEKWNAGQLARTEVVSVAADESLAQAAQHMADHETSHLIVVQPHSGHPVGVLSALDLAGVLAWGAPTR